MKNRSIPYVFNPKRDRNIRRFMKLKRFSTILFTLCAAFLLTTFIFGRHASGGSNLMYIGLILSILTGAFVFIVHRKLKQQKR